MENKVCAKCGAELLEGQEFCSKCGTPANKKVCSKCGALLNDDQEFCPKCGQKVSLAVDADVSSAINQFNANLGEKKKKKSKKAVLIVAIIAALVAIAAVVFFIVSGSFKGQYMEISGEPDSYYKFEDDYYIYKTDDDTERGKYKVEKDQVILTDSDGDDTTFYRDGKYIFSSNVHFDDTIKDGNDTQTLKKTSSTQYEGHTLSINQELKLNSDGTYKYTLEMTYIGVTIGDKVEESGTYTRSGKLLVLSPKGENYTKTYIVKDGFVYNDVYEKD